MNQHRSVTRREALALAGLASAALLAPAQASAESPAPNPQGMLTSMPTANTMRTRRSTSPSWITSSASSSDKAFMDGYGRTYLDPARKVIDVSEWQGLIDWRQVKESGVDGAILRTGYGNEGVDARFKRNVRECDRLGIPYGVYHYSYAYNETYARQEAQNTLSLLREANASPTLPIFYDLEEWTWAGHTPPSDPATYERIVNAYCAVMEEAGITNVRVYSYRSYFRGGPLDSPEIWKRGAWVAEYGTSLQLENPYYENCLAWQYTSGGSVPGISGSVDVNAFPPFSKLAFSDVLATTDHTESVWWLAEKGISTGWADGTFRGLASVARQDMAAFLYRLAGEPSYTPSTADRNRFADVNETTDHHKEVWWLGSTGISTGWADGTFRGLAPVARQDMAAFLHRLSERYHLR